MGQKHIRLGALVLTLALALTACAPAAPGGASSEPPASTSQPLDTAEVVMQDMIPTIQPEPAAVEGFNTYIRRYKALLDVEKTAAEKL